MDNSKAVTIPVTLERVNYLLWSSMVKTALEEEVCEVKSQLVSHLNKMSKEKMARTISWWMREMGPRRPHSAIYHPELP